MTSAPIPAKLRVERAWPLGWTWRFTGGPDRGRWSTAGWALTECQATYNGHAYVKTVAKATGQAVTLRWRKDFR